jgi:hypothetical protein
LRMSRADFLNALVDRLRQIRTGAFSWRGLFGLRQSDDERAQIFECEAWI